ncbi:MAG: hypothetical protein FJX35_07925 [Alphaproteobacteria bacterium]|nr:hypothetical protein [Alphaproteobacteria bacterium]
MAENLSGIAVEDVEAFAYHGGAGLTIVLKGGDSVHFVFRPEQVSLAIERLATIAEFTRAEAEAEGEKDVYFDPISPTGVGAARTGDGRPLVFFLLGGAVLAFHLDGEQQAALKLALDSFAH